MIYAHGPFHPDCISWSMICSLNLNMPSESTSQLAGSVTEAAFHNLIHIASLYLIYWARATWAGVSPKSFAGTNPASAVGGPPPPPPPPGTWSTVAVTLLADHDLALDMIINNKNSSSKIIFFGRIYNIAIKRSGEEAWGIARKIGSTSNRITFVNSRCILLLNIMILIKTLHAYLKSCIF
jgi:hypothetical protein